MPLDIGLGSNHLQHDLIDTSDISVIKRQIEQIHIAIERLEKQILAFDSTSSPYVQSLVDIAFEEGYSEGYEHGLDDAYNAQGEEK